jgi:hypothetical protein
VGGLVVAPENLNQTQFANHVHPHQLAILGMEGMAHPWAKHLARGFMLDFSTSKREHHLSALDVSHPKYPEEAATLDWSRGPGEGRNIPHPGEIQMVANFQAGDKPSATSRNPAAGLAGALMRSAHHWDFGQETLPIHSPLRTEAGEHFASKTMPELKPDTHVEPHSGRRVSMAEGKNPEEPPRWPGVGAEFHPYQQEIMAKRGGLEGMRERRRAANSGQGKLF